MTTWSIRRAEPADAARLVELIEALAAYEHLSHTVTCTQAALAAALAGDRPQVEALLAFDPGGARQAAAGFALYYPTFSTFLGRPGLWLEDLFVRTADRGRGCGSALLRAIADIARARGYGRFEWSVLDWNVAAHGFYRRLGAEVLPDWRIVRIDAARLAALPAGDPPASA